MITINAYLADMQDLYMEIRAARRIGEPVPHETIVHWEQNIKAIDKVTRDRLFVLTVAAEKGWPVAIDLVAGMRGTHRFFKPKTCIFLPHSMGCRR
jgi:hypothetical protein